ncbi:hypothetical protein [Chryseobacterium paridis]|uniref:Uncharacterized protein n=1 Tax=Chryseobacterium paridis TaxID=2800328 RepID=A0ABS1FV42_9FLAO|nr:hypothetical protein [Chryseobacterium paridis]MBK1896303.1 hypothetical protein [Chryseobacterium paridis]
MTTQTLEIDLKKSMTNLFQLIEKFCWNKVSQNCLYILSDFNEFGSPNPKNYQNSRRMVNRGKIPKSLDFVVHELDKEYNDLYDITLYVFRAKKNLTIIEIQYYRKSNFDEAYFAVVKDNPPMFHAKISHPVYVRNQDVKFDINWESGNLRHNLNLLMYRWKIKNNYSDKK